MIPWHWFAAAGLVVLAAVVGTLVRRQKWRDSMTLSILGWLFIAVLIAAGTGGGLLWLLGWPSVPRSSEFTTAETLDLLKIALAVVAGFGGVVVLSVNHRKQRFAEKAHALAEGQEDRERTKLLNERFAAAVEQLAHERPQVRLAGVYALAGLADDWPAGRQQCVEVLIAYLRLGQSEDRFAGPGEAEVTDTIFRTFRDRLDKAAHGPWTLLDFDFTGMTLADADFGGLEFRGAVTFDGVTFTGLVASFADTRFFGTLSCHGAVFTADVTDFQRSWFYGKAEFVGAEFHAPVNLGGAMVHTGEVDFYRCVLTSTMWCNLLAVLSGVVRFDGCELTGATLDFRRVLVGPSRPPALFDRVASGRFASLVIQNCVLDESAVQLHEADVAHGRIVVMDLDLLRSELRIAEGIPRPSLLVRRIEERDSTVEIPGGEPADGLPDQGLRT